MRPEGTEQVLAAFVVDTYVTAVSRPVEIGAAENFVLVGAIGIQVAGSIGSDTDVVVGIAALGRVCAINSLKKELVFEVYVTRCIGSRRCLLGSRRCLLGSRRRLLG